MNPTELNIFGLKASPAPSANALEKAITPFLGSGLKLLKKKPTTKAGKETLYLASNLPIEAYVHESLAIHGQKKNLKKTLLQTLADDVPLSKAEFLAVFNRMLDAGQLQVTSVDDKFAIQGVRLVTSGFGHQTSGFREENFTSDHSPLATSHSQLKSHVPTKSDVDLFHEAFDKLDRGRIYVRICNMRRELGWSEERFNTLLRELRANGTIQLHAGDVSTLTEEDVNLSYTDEYNFFYATLTWKKQ